MSNEVEKIAEGKIKPQSACKKWKSKKLGKNEYWTPTLLGDKKIETMDMETGFIEEALTEKSNGEVKDKINDMELLAKLQTSESILGSRILRNVREGD